MAIPTKKLNQANDDIWLKLNLAVQSKNWALLEKNLGRLYGLQSEYVKRLNLAEHEIRELQIMVNASESEITRYQRQFMIETAKKTGTLDLVNERLEELFGK